MTALVPRPQEHHYLKASEYQGLLLAANPCNPPNRLQNSVLLVVKEQNNNIMALQINLPATDLDLNHIVGNLGFDIGADQPVFFGGNLNPNRLHFIHSMDWSGLTTIMVNDRIGVTSDISILAALSENQGPSQFRACAGHWSWNVDTLAQQLDTRSNPDQDYKWESVAATTELIFDRVGNDQWSATLEASAQAQVEHWF